MKNPLDSLDAVVQALVAALKPQRVLLFGSGARPGATEINDLDLLVIAESSAPPIDRIVDARMAVASLGVPVDLFVYTPAEATKLRSYGSSIVAEAERSGRLLYEAA